MGTGIVFVVLAAIWVVYFVQYWSRRREHLATARSVESFAEAMRVLERRPALRANTSGRGSSAYAMSPTRVVRARPAPRPQVIAKPQPTPSRPPSMPQRGGAPDMPPIPSLPVRRSKSASRGPVRMSPSRKVRGLTLLATLAATLVTAVLAAFSVLLWWVPLIAVAAAGAVFLWLRAGVQSEIAARKAMRRRVVRTRTPRASTAAAPADRSAAAQQGSEWTAPEELLETTSVDAAASAGGVDAGAAVDTPADRPDGWQPVPVPPPTYTLKAKAERPLPSDDAAAVGEVPTASGTGESAPATGEMQDEQRAAYGT